MIGLDDCMNSIRRRDFIKLAMTGALSCARAGLSLASSTPEEIFSDRTKESGIDFVHFNGMSGAHFYPEVMGSGVALFDYDNDGDLDIFFVQGAMLGPNQDLNRTLFHPQMPLRGKLYRNDSIRHADGSVTLKFVDVTEESGIRALGYGMGVAAADFNNDGWVDLYITNFGHNQMWRNNGDGTFTDVTAQSGTGAPGWSASAAFVDFDRDGWLDLFVCNYVDFRFTDLKKCLAPSGALDYCGPLSFKPLANRLFRNRRDGTLAFGCALNRDGGPHSSMGIDAGDLFGHGQEDLVITNLAGQYAYVYANGKGGFEDRSYESGIALATRRYTGFGVAMLDYDNDGHLDLLMVNGGVTMIEAQAREGSIFPLAQSKLLFHGNGDGTFANVTSGAGAAFSLLEVSRGAAFGDIDNDGDIDVVIANNSGPARLLINNVGHQKPWIGFRMVGEKSNRDMYGTRVAVFRKNAPTLWRCVHSDGSYCSSSDPRVLFGLGDFTEVTKVQAHWLSGRVEEWDGLPLGKYTTLREGSGSTKSSA